MPPLPLTLRWIASVSASCLHAADAVARGRTLADPRLAAAIVAPAIGLRDEIRAAALPADRFWRQLLALSHQIDSDRELVSVSIRKTVGSSPSLESLAQRLARWISVLETTVRQAIPGIVDELDMRSRPLRELWEARGPGLLHAVGKLTDPRLLVENAEVVIVLPALGGGGAAQLSNNSVRIEAVLTNNVPNLPEVVRLGWLLAQLNCDLPVFSEAVPPSRLAVISELALIPPILQAAQEVELAELSQQTVAAAILAWQLESGADPPGSESLLVWWRTYQETRPDWRTALAALERMMPGSSR